MAIACPIDLDTLRLRAEIQSIYARVAVDPTGEFHFHRGPEYATRRLGYDADELMKLPPTVTNRLPVSATRTPLRRSRVAPRSSTSDVVPVPTCCWRPFTSDRKDARLALT
jgi:arsenite methyltransferase